MRLSKREYDCFGGFLENPRLWRFSSGSRQAENMIKVPENGLEGVCVRFGAQALLAILFGSFPKAFQRGEYMRLSKRE